jgi:hypothetical protein
MQLMTKLILSDFVLALWMMLMLIWADAPWWLWLAVWAYARLRVALTSAALDITQPEQDHAKPD